MLINGLLDTYEACFDEKLIQFAEKLQDIQDKLFWDENDNGYFATAAGNESEIVLRLKDGDCCINYCSLWQLLKPYCLLMNWKINQLLIFSELPTF